MAATKDHVFAAADQIAAAGQRPTLEAVRRITGGSYTTISPLLGEWKALKATSAAPLREPAPQAVSDRLAEVGAEVWALALGLANSRLAAERDALEKARAETQAEAAEAAGLADELRSELEQMQSSLASAEVAAQAARTEADELRSALAEAQEQARTSATRAVEIERRADDLRTELDKTHKDAAQSAKAAAQAREEAAGLTGQIKALHEQYAALLARISPTDGQAKPSKPTQRAGLAA